MPPAPLTAPTGEDLLTTIRSGLRGEIRPVPISWGYRLALGAVAAAMVFLPLVYFLLVGSLFAFLLWFAIHFFPGRFAGMPTTVDLLAYGLPLGIGGLLLYALIRPLAQPEDDSDTVVIDPGVEPGLHLLVGELCRVLHAPVPREIRVDCQANAAAGLGGGLGAMFGRDLVLTVGLPLVEGLSLQQLAGVLAHELGHFSQHAGMRLQWAIVTVNYWFARLVYAPSVLDLGAGEAGARAAAFQAATFASRLLFRPARGILWLLMMIGHGLSRIMMRQKEYDADRYEIQLAGFTSFDFSMRELVALGTAYHIAMTDLQQMWKDRRLVDNLPRLVLACRRREVRRIAAFLETQMAAERGGMWSTHPTIRERLARALKQRGAGLLASTLPATALFRDLEGLELRATRALYRRFLGYDIAGNRLVATRHLLSEKERREDERAARGRYFQHFDRIRGLPVPVAVPPPPADPAAAVAELSELRRALHGHGAGHARHLESYRKEEARLIPVRVAQELLAIEIPIDFASFEIDRSDSRGLRTGTEIRRRIAELAARLEPFEQAEGRRLVSTLAFLGVPEIAARIPDAESRRAEVPGLLTSAARLSALYAPLYRIYSDRAVLEDLYSAHKPEERPPELRRVLASRQEGFHERLAELRADLDREPYPFDRSRTLAQVAVGALPEKGDLGATLRAIAGTTEQVHEICDRILGRLADTAERIEAALGLPPLTHAALAAAPTASPEAAARTEAAAPAAEEGRAAPVPSPRISWSSPAGEAAPIVESKAEAVASREAFARFFRGWIELRALTLPASLPPPSAAAELAEIRRSAQAELAAFEQAGRLYRRAERRQLLGFQAESLLRAGVEIDPAPFEVHEATPAGVLGTRKRLEASMSAQEPVLAAFEALQSRRLITALSLLPTAPVADVERRWREIFPILASAAALQELRPATVELRALFAILNALGGHAGQAIGRTARFRAVVAERMAAAHRLLLELHRTLHAAPAAFAAPHGGAATLAQLTLPAMPETTDFDGIFKALSWFLQERNDLNRRLLGRLALVAEEVEGAVSGAAG